MVAFILGYTSEVGKSGERCGRSDNFLNETIWTFIMQIFWHISQFPELDHLDPIERAAVLRGVPWWTYPQLAVGAIIVGVVAGIVTLLFAFFHGLGGWEAWAPGVVVTIIVVIHGYVSGVKGIRKSMRKELIKFFAGHRPPFCL